MPKSTARTYRSALRDEQARRTRGLVLDAAAACFGRRGYAATTMKEIAAEAGVSPQTVFAQGGKAALLLAAVDRSLTGDDEEVPLRAREAVQHLIRAQDKAEKLALLREVTRATVPRVLPMLRVFRDAAGDPEIATAWAEYERRRYEDMHALVASFAPLLRDGLTVDEATDVYWSVFTTETMDTFLRGRGWSIERYADWSVDAADRLLALAAHEPGLEQWLPAILPG
ncbi:TetR/AcrR family transcriptional regulator [Pseudonocardia sp. RS010]|uniref:TetR/AcrR family transcriptional regulator n=1 Tax=Pseudonocardia sp. RS010 TaxID=3385979 RepID=UPI0039A072FB